MGVLLGRSYRESEFTDGQLVGFVGVKIYYASGSRVSRIASADLLGGWGLEPSTRVQVVRPYSERKYCPEHGPTYERGHLCRVDCQHRHYALTFCKADFYWWSPTQEFGASNLFTDIPLDGISKTGSLLDKQLFLDIYNRAMNDHEF